LRKFAEVFTKTKESLPEIHQNGKIAQIHPSVEECSFFRGKPVAKPAIRKIYSCGKKNPTEIDQRMISSKKLEFSIFYYFIEKTA
jgi:hypothetical protein